MTQETCAGLYGHKHISGNVKCTWILWKWKIIRTWGTCSAAPLQHTSYTYPETLGSWPTLFFQAFILRLTLFQGKVYIMCGKAYPFRKKKKKDFNFEF